MINQTLAGLKESPGRFMDSVLCPSTAQKLLFHGMNAEKENADGHRLSYDPKVATATIARSQVQ